MSERCQKNGSRSSSKHSTKVCRGTVASRWEETCGSSWWPISMPNAAHSPAARRQTVGPPAHEASKLLTSMAPSTMRSRRPAERDLALAGRDAQPGLVAHVAHPAPIVDPAAGLLEPEDVEVLGQPRELDGLGPLVALVGIDHDHEVGPGSLTGESHAPGILRRRAPADLELHAREAAWRSRRRRAASHRRRGGSSHR